MSRPTDKCPVCKGTKLVTSSICQGCRTHAHLLQRQHEAEEAASRKKDFAAISGACILMPMGRKVAVTYKEARKADRYGIVHMSGSPFTHR